MRFLLTGAVWVIILGLLYAVFSVRTPELVSVQEKSKPEFPVSFEITTTFAVEEDPFALNIGQEASAFSIVLNGKEVFSAEDGIRDRESFTTEEFMVSGGKHEVFITANPSDTSVSQSVRVRALASGNPVSDKTYWFAPGQTVNASHIFTLETANNEH